MLDDFVCKVMILNGCVGFFWFWLDLIQAVSLTAKLQKNRPDGRFFALGKRYQLMSKREGENPRRVRAEQLAAMNGRRPPRRGEPRSGESSLPYRQIKQKAPSKDGAFCFIR